MAHNCHAGYQSFRKSTWGLHGGPTLLLVVIRISFHHLAIPTRDLVVGALLTDASCGISTSASSSIPSLLRRPFSVEGGAG